jgi:hypothetical protein
LGNDGSGGIDTGRTEKSPIVEGIVTALVLTELGPNTQGIVLAKLLKKIRAPLSSLPRIGGVSLAASPKLAIRLNPASWRLLSTSHPLNRNTTFNSEGR